ncbi:MAG: prepilin-type N-terminal cleavage/methylation domain-containing protein [Longimicrobiales bacterium]|nr:prepilin-type N-terminal cleavage/methylation domain-containing protein [Longimicrobiales bacterium]
MTTHLQTRRAGMTLVELVIALTIFGVIISTALVFMSRQNEAYQTSLRRTIALRNVRYAVTTLRQDLETLGTNVGADQPPLVHADDDVVVFSADHTTNVSGDPFAVFHDPDAPSGSVIAPSGSFSIPNASQSWPGVAYESAPGIRSSAEAILFWFAPDVTTARTDDYQLMRRVNTGEPDVVARRLLRDGSEPFFTYVRLVDQGGGLLPTPVPDSLLPLHHAVASHGSAADTGAVAIIDAVRAVRVRFRATDGEPGDRESIVGISRLIALPNSGQEILSTCGTPPILGSALNATVATLSTGEVGVALGWGPAIDESGGEADVVRYVLWRREVGNPSWGEPWVAIPAGAPTYTFEDATVSSGTGYLYALAAQDCTPTLSPRTTAGPVIIP